jgi:hypothetical protein
MWEQSKYFEDFENAANYIHGRFDPKGAQALRASQRQQMEEQARTQREVRTIAQRHRPQAPRSQG